MATSDATRNAGGARVPTRVTRDGWIPTSSSLPKPGTRIEFRIDTRECECALMGTYADGQFVSHWARYERGTVREWRAHETAADIAVATAWYMWAKGTSASAGDPIRKQHFVLDRLRALLSLFLCTCLLSCMHRSTLPASVGYGTSPVLPAPESSLIPVVNVAPAAPWTGDAGPIAAAGFSVAAYARDLSHPRWLYVLPNGDTLVAETNAPTRPDDGKGVRARFTRVFMKRAGAAEQSANRITLLRDADSDGVAESRSIFIDGLNSPFGMALIGDAFYVANTDAIVRFTYHTGDLHLASPGTQVITLPAGTINHHWTKNILASRDGTRLYATVGSNSNVAENGIDAEENRAEILEINLAHDQARVFASGLRNPNGLAWQPRVDTLWTVVNERDEIGNDLVPDYLTSVRDGGFYGWPYSYYGDHVDVRIQPQRPDKVKAAIVPDYALGAHTASLGLVFYEANAFPARYRDGAFIGQHGSWNRKPRSGYKVVFVPFRNGKAVGPTEDVLTGFVSDNGNAYGRPVGVAVGRDGALLVADDVGNRVWRVTSTVR